MLIGIDGNEANTQDRVGSNVYAFELITEITRQDQDNEYIIYLREKRVLDLPNERDKFRYRIIPPKKFWTQWRLPLDLYLHRPRPDLFFTPGHYAPRFSPIPTVISIMDLAFLKFPEVYQPAVLHQLKTWTQYSVTQSHHIFAISESTKQDVISAYGVNPNRITVTYPGVHPRYRQAYSAGQIQQIVRKYNLPDKYFLFIGTKQPRKNLDRLIQATGQLPDANLVVVGKTWSQFRQSSVISHQSSVIELGFVPDEDIPPLMLGSQALVLPSLYEGFGIPVAEAMAVGTPVAVSKVSSLPEIVGDAGILIDPYDVNNLVNGLKQILDLTPSNRVKLVRAAQARANRFTWQACAAQTLEVLNGFAVQR